jgi:hypothetical protein
MEIPRIGITILHPPRPGSLDNRGINTFEKNPKLIKKTLTGSYFIQRETGALTTRIKLQDIMDQLLLSFFRRPQNLHTPPLDTRFEPFETVFEDKAHPP